jgi:hypothetical protein
MHEQQAPSSSSSRDRTSRSPPSADPTPIDAPLDLPHDPLPVSKGAANGGVAGAVLRGVACFACAGFVAFVIAFGVTSTWWHPPPAQLVAATPADDDPLPPLACQFIGSKAPRSPPPLFETPVPPTLALDLVPCKGGQATSGINEG